MSGNIIFYDLPSRDPCKCWSLNPWKTRFVLNYKSLPYKTEWVEYPDLASKFKELNVTPNDIKSPTATANMHYTSPCITLPTGESMLDSIVIAQHLEKLHPSPPLHLDSPYLQKVIDTIPLIAGALAPVYVPRVPRMLLNERSASYFTETREKRFGMPLDALEKSEKGGQVAFSAAAKPLGTIVALLQEKPEGPFFEGNTISYTDFVFVSFLRFMERLDVLWNVLDACEAGKEGGRKTAEDLYFACGKWMERDDH